MVSNVINDLAQIHGHQDANYSLQQYMNLKKDGGDMLAGVRKPRGFIPLKKIGFASVGCCHVMVYTDSPV
jgi:hypothetical protein